MKWTGEIKHFAVTGDIHGQVNEIAKFCENYNIKETALIILGDVGFNFYLNKTDNKNKEYVQSLGCLVYCVRGNHEERPENIPGMKCDYDETVKGWIRYEEQYPNIRYLQDGDIYNMQGYSCLVIGGAYSVDKQYRLTRAQLRGVNIETEWTGWFKDEQLTEEEMFNIENRIKDVTVDFVLTHTCPYSWMPFDLFLKGVDQSTVDNTMERWLDNVKDEIHWNCAWLFGHYHEDRIVRPHVEMYMNTTDTLDEIAKRWKEWDEGYRLDWWLNSRLDPTWRFWQEELNKRQKKKNVSLFGSPDFYSDEDYEDFSDEEYNC